MTKLVLRLPGLEKQFDFLLNHIPEIKGTLLIIGYGLEGVVEILATLPDVKMIYYAVENEEALLQSRILLGDSEKVKIRYMEFDALDPKDESIDLVYTQGAISKKNRNKILKEIKRVLSKDGLLCVGETVALREEIPAFVKDIWDRSGLVPMNIEKLSEYYRERKYQIIAEEDLTNTLRDYYIYYYRLLQNKKGEEEIEENRVYRKLFAKIKHEVTAYLKLGGDKYMGFKTLLVRKINQ